MGTIDHGTQSLAFEYHLSATATNFNKVLHRIIPTGIYYGAQLTRLSDSIVTLSPFALEINDGTEQMSVSSVASATLATATLDSGDLSSATPYLVFRWTQTSEVINYVEIHATAAPQPLDIVIGKITFSGSTITGFDYSERTEPNTQEHALQVISSQASELYVYVNGGRVNTPTGSVHVAMQKIGPFSAPASPNSRIDLVYVDTAGAVQVQQGTAAPSPSAPSYLGKLVLAQVLVANGVVDITDSVITDVRAPIVGPIFPDGVTLTQNGSGLLQSSSVSVGTRVFTDSAGGAFASGSVYRASGDGYFTGWSNAGGFIVMKAGASNPPTVEIDRINVAANDYAGRLHVHGLIKSGEYVKIESSSGLTANWIPLGVGELVKQ